MPSWSNRNNLTPGVIGAYIAGIICVVVGFNLALEAQVNLVTGQVSSPHQGIGYGLVVLGFVVVSAAQRVAKRNLQK